MRIILVAGTFPQLSETFILRKAIALAERGHQVTVATRKRGNWVSFPDYLPLPVGLSIKHLLPEWGWSNPRRAMSLVGGLPVHLFRSPLRAFNLIRTCHHHAEMNDLRWRQFVRHLAFIKMRADVLHFEFLDLAALYPLVPQLVKVPFVVSCRGADLHLLEQQKPDLQRRKLDALRGAAGVHCVSTEMVAEVSRISGRTQGLWINRPAVATDTIIPKQNYLATGPPLIISVGRLVWKKGIDYLLAALSRLKQSGVAFRAQIIGDGPLHAALRFSVEDLNLEPEVELLGSLPSAEVLQRLRNADLFVLSSHEEGISNSVLEAMATGLPIMTTNAGGMGEAVSDGIEGYVVPIRDIPLMADRLGRLLTDVGQRERMGRAARSKAEAEFSLSRQAEVFEQLYQSVKSSS